jgi:ATP-binding cassette subfamily B protein
MARTPRSKNSFQHTTLEKWQDRPIALMFHYAALHPVAHITVIASILGAVACATGSQYAIKNLIDKVSGGGSGFVWLAYAILVTLIVADNLFWRVAGWVASKLFVRVAADVRNDLFRYVSGHSPDYFVNRLPGTVSGRVSSAANSVFTIESAFAWQVFPPCIAVVGSIVVMMTVNLVMGVTLVAVAIALSVLIYKLAKRGTGIHHAYASEAAQLEGELVDVISNMNVVRLFGATLQEQQRFGQRVDSERSARQVSLQYLERLRLIHALVTALLTAGLLGWVLVLWGHGQATPGDIVLVSSLGFAVLHGTRDLAVSLVDMIQHVARLSESTSALLIPHGLPDRADAQTLVVPRGNGVQIAFEAVQFAYPGRDPVLNGLTLRVEAGETVGLVGRSGAGKSTILALLQRFYDVQQGSILIAGRDVRDLTQQSLRETIGVVPQDISLFHRTLLENIRYGRPGATEAEAMEAAEAAGCREFIEAMPEGFQTIVGDRGVKLSGGQRQRIAIARAFLKDAPALLLDEATSALDSESEQVIKRALDKLMRNRTVVAVAHRLSTLNKFDRIVVMDEGRVVDMGPPLELANRPGPYRDLLERQQGAMVEG